MGVRPPAPFMRCACTKCGTDATEPSVATDHLWHLHVPAGSETKTSGLSRGAYLIEWHAVCPAALPSFLSCRLYFLSARHGGIAYSRLVCISNVCPDTKRGVIVCIVKDRRAHPSSIPGRNISCHIRADTSERRRYEVRPTNR